MVVVAVSMVVDLRWLEEVVLPVLVRVDVVVVFVVVVVVVAVVVVVVVWLMLGNTSTIAPNAKKITALTAPTTKGRRSVQKWFGLFGREAVSADGARPASNASGENSPCFRWELLGDNTAKGIAVKADGACSLTRADLAFKYGASSS